MATRLRAAGRAARRRRMLCGRLSESLTNARLAAGLSVREIAQRTVLSADTIRRVERGDAPAFTIDTLTRLGEALGLELAASFYPAGDPVRDRAHLLLLGRLRVRLGTSVRWRTEVPIPLAGDLRSGDAVVGLEAGGDALVEAETHLGDLQLIERRSAAKQRDLGAARLIILVSDTRNNREVIRLHPELRERFPVGMRTCLRRLTRGEDPGGDALIVL